MGTYVNPENAGFAEINRSEYVDKTLLIEIVNKTIGKENRLTCVSRPRRFGKTFAAKMLTAYYDCSCDSHSLFAVFVMDEWDAVIREVGDDLPAQEAYFDLLRGWFENRSFTPRAVAAAYVTGILPIGSDPHQWIRAVPGLAHRAYPKGFRPHSLCGRKGMSFRPHSWRGGKGAGRAGSRPAAGREVKLDTDLTAHGEGKDVLTLLVHLGYLTSDAGSKTICIPNGEVRRDFQRAIREAEGHQKPPSSRASFMV